MTMAQHDGNLPSRSCAGPAAFSFSDFQRSAGACNTTFSVTSTKTSMRRYTQQLQQQLKQLLQFHELAARRCIVTINFSVNATSLRLTIHFSSLFGIALQR
jgi:hypothetical protein